MIYDTIAAISSPPGTGAISVIRVSGEKIKKIINDLFRKIEFEPGKMYYSYLYDEEKFVDEVTFVYHQNPKSFTGEDMLEIFGHGGQLISNNIMKAILKNGARQALPGEFSKRAVLNGKMNMMKAEFINDMIHANTEIALNSSLNSFHGKLIKEIEELKNSLITIASRMEVELDYPDDFEPDNFKTLAELEEVKIKIEEILRNSDNGISAVKGIKTAITGRPNSGKSTLLNALLKTNRAIVTDIPGTTRDTIEENLNIGGIFIRLIDTAGIRETEDIVEKIGVERSKDAINNSELILLVIDGTEELSDEDKEIMKYINDGNKECIVVINKKDSDKFKKEIEENEIIKKYNQVSISAKNWDTKELEKKIFDSCIEKVTVAEPTLTNERQKYALEGSLNFIKFSIESTKNSMTNDIIMYDVRNAVEKLYELTGQNYTEELLEKMFSTFCVGK